MQSAEFGHVVAEFYRMADGVKEQLSNILNLLEDGRVPDQKSISEFDAAMERLQEQYDAVYSLTQSMVADGELPTEGCSISECVQAVDASKLQQIKAQLREIETVLQRFVDVRSLMAECSQALAPYQEKASQMLQQLKNNYSAISPEVVETSDGHRIFLKILDEKNLQSEEKFRLLEKAGSIYPQVVQIGLAMGQYYIPDGTSAEPVSSQTINENVGRNSTPNEGRLHPKTLEKEPEIAITDENSSKELFHAKTKVKDGLTLSAKSFTGDVSNVARIYHKAHFILPFFTHLGALTVDQIYEVGIALDFLDDPADKPDISATKIKISIKNTLDELIAKNCLVAYETDAQQPERDVYCLTHYGHRCLAKSTIVNLKLSKSGRSFWALPLGHHPLHGGDTIEKNTLNSAVSQNNLLLNYLHGMKEQLSREEYNKITASISWKENHFSVVVPWEGENFSCQIIESVCDAKDSAENILIIADTLEEVNDSFYKNRECFIFNHGKLTRCCDTVSDVANAVEPDNITDAVNKMPGQTKKAEEPATDVSSTGEPAALESPEKRQEAPEGEATTLETIYDALGNGDVVKASQIILDAQVLPDDDLMEELIFALLKSAGNEPESEVNYRGITRAILLAKAASFEKNYPKSKKLYQQLLLATNLPLDNVDYTGINLLNAFPTPMNKTESMMLSAYLYGLLFPNQTRDYTLWSQADQLLSDYDSVFPSYPALKSLFNTLCNVKDTVADGFTDTVLSLLGDKAESTAFVERLQSEAETLMHHRKTAVGIKINGLPEMCSACFGHSSDLYTCLEIIHENRRSEKELVKSVLAEYCDEGEDSSLELSEQKIDQKLDQEWARTRLGNNMIRLTSLQYVAKQQILNAFYRRLRLMKTWCEIEDVENRHYNTGRIYNLRTEILSVLNELTADLTPMYRSDEPCILLRMLDLMRRRLQGDREETLPFADLLSTGIISLDDDGIPVMDESLCDVKYYEPWRNVLRHITAPVLSLKEARDEVFRRGSSMQDNLHQLLMIENYLSGPGHTVSRQDIISARKTAEIRTKEFKDRLELDYTFYRIDEDSKENLFDILEMYRENFFPTPEQDVDEPRDFGCWGQFLHALGQQIEDFTAQRQSELRKDLSERRARLHADGTSLLLEEAERLLEQDKNFTVAEEYINRFDNGETQFSEDELTATQDSGEGLSEFLSDESFEPIYNTCRRNTGKPLKKFGVDYVIQAMKAKTTSGDWTSRLRDDSQTFLENWPVSKDIAGTDSQLRAFFSSLGFTVNGIKKISGTKEEQYSLLVTKVDANRTDYNHPIAAFGTQMKSPLSVLVLYGKHPAREIIEILASMKNPSGPVIVLIDHFLDKAERRQVAETFHTQTSWQRPFLLIDRVLVLYLAMHQSAERLPSMLKCTLPYTTYQPFLRDGGAVAEEMFFGRRSELASILQPTGACVVYGGRQLGKTALLQRAESRFHAPENQAYAVFSDIKDYKQEGPLVEKLCGDITGKTGLSFTSCNTLKGLCDQIGAMFRKHKIASMLLLIDEADNFLEAISKVKYAPLQPLIELKRVTKNNFKFVLAGLHNVCRAKNATALNGIFGQLGSSLCIKPLSPIDAIQLLSRPLRYLGFQIENPHLETILTNTNYYPGILQFFGYTLVQTFMDDYEKYYNVNNNPPFPLKEAQLGSIMNSADLNRSIRDKFQWSLDLDEHYSMLARCIVLLHYYYAGERRLGFTVDDIKQVVTSYDIHCLKEKSSSEQTVLLDEMVDMGILSKPRQDSNPSVAYRMRRHAFIDYVGASIESIEKDIRDNNKAEVSHDDK